MTRANGNTPVAGQRGTAEASTGAIVDAAAVAQLVLRERQSRDRGSWDDWSDCFVEDSLVDMSWFTGSGAEFVNQTRHRSADGL